MHNVIIVGTRTITTIGTWTLPLLHGDCGGYDKVSVNQIIWNTFSTSSPIAFIMLRAFFYLNVNIHYWREKWCRFQGFKHIVMKERKGAWVGSMSLRWMIGWTSLFLAAPKKACRFSFKDFVVRSKWQSLQNNLTKYGYIYLCTYMRSNKNEGPIWNSWYHWKALDE